MVFEEDIHTSFVAMLAALKAQQDDIKGTKKKTIQVHADDLINFHALREKEEGEQADEFELNLSRATGGEQDKRKAKSKLSKVHQLSGFSDPVYAEAYVHVNQYDIGLDGMYVWSLMLASLPPETHGGGVVTRYQLLLTLVP